MLKTRLYYYKIVNQIFTRHIKEKKANKKKEKKRIGIQGERLGVP
jgi:hypothetical protein